jgi:hypothetical protein
MVKKFTTFFFYHKNANINEKINESPHEKLQKIIDLSEEGKVLF